MARIWRCSCGEEFPGDTDGTAAAFGHMMVGRRQDGREAHASCPLIDTETGDTLMTWPNVKNAQREGFIGKKDDSIYAQQKEKKQRGKSPIKASSATSGVPYRGRMPFKEIAIPPELYYLYILSMAEFGYDDTPEAFTDWLVSCVMNLHIKFPEAFGFDKFLISAATENGALDELLKSVVGAEEGVVE